MTVPGFLQEKQKQKKGKSNKGDFRQKCLTLLEEIKKLSEERYLELNKIFQSKYNSVNIQKKKILGFYAQLVEEVAKLKDAAGIEIKKTTKRIVSTKRVAEVKHNVVQVINKAKQEAKRAEKEVEKVVEKATGRVKKVVSSAPAKKAKKKAGKVAKKAVGAAKKTAKKAKSGAKKVAKKTAKKAKAGAKKVAKKKAKKKAR